MRVILATGKPELDSFLSERAPGIEVVDVVHYREALGDVARRWQPEAAVVSTLLQGQVSMAEAVFPLRVRDVRVVVLCGRRPQKVSDPEMAEIAELLAIGVTDFLFSPIKADDVVARLKEPWTFGRAVRDLLRGARPPSRGLGTLLGKLALQASEVKPRAEPPREEAPRPEQHPGDAAPGGQGRQEEPAPVLGRTSRPSFGFWSPAGAGASTLALSVAYLLSRDRDVGLLDLGDPPAQGALLCLPQQDFMGAVLGSLPGAVPELPEVGRVRVLPGTPGLRPSPGEAGRLLSPGTVPGDVLVVDLPRSGPLLEAVLPALWAVVLVGDPDWQHAEALRDALSYLRGRGVRVLPVLNRHAAPEGVAGFQARDVFGEEPVAVVPALPAKVYGAVAFGDPAAKRCGEIAAALIPLVRALAGEEREVGY